MVQTVLIPLLPPLLLLLAGVALALRGWRGRRVSDHPVCRRCGFDLFNRSPDSTACPECGAALTSPRAVRHGQRQKRTGLLAAGALLLACGLAYIGVGTWVGLRGVDLNPYKPTWWLIRDASGTSPAARDAALTTLIERLEKKRLSDADVTRLTDRALALQANKTKPWVRLWGDLFLAAAAAGKVDNDKARRFAEQAFVLTLQARPRVSRKDDRLPLWIVLGPSRAGTRSQGSAVVRFREPSIDDRPVLNGFDLGEQTIDLGGGGRHIGTSITLSESVKPPLADGRHVLRLPAEVSVSLLPPHLGSDKKKVVFESTWELLPPGEETVTVVRDKKHRPGIIKAVSVRSVQYWRRDYLHVTVSTDPPPVGIGFEVFLRAGGIEERLGTFARPAGGKPHGFGVGKAVKLFGPERGDLILRPSAAAATATIDTFEVWAGEEIVIPDVKVERAP